MLQNIRLTDSIDRQKWEEFVLNHPNGNIFQTPDMHEVYRRTKNYEPIALAVLDESNEIVALTQAVVIKEIGGPLGIFTARAVMQGGPLYLEGNNKKEAVRMLMEHYNNVARKKVLYTQIRNMWGTRDISKIVQDAGYGYEDHLDFLVYLKKSTDELWSGLSKSRRRGVKNAKKEGLIVKELKERHLLNNFYNLLSLTHKDANMPLAHISLFESVFDVLMPKGKARFFSVRYSDKEIASRVVLLYKQSIFSWYRGFDRKYAGLYPNDLLVWDTIIWGHESNYTTLSMGGAGKPTVKYGVRDFKKQFGGKLINYGRYEMIHHPIKMKLSKKIYKIYKNCIGGLV